MVEPKSSRRGALSSNRTQERLLAASAWPTLEFGTGNRSDSGTDEITLVLGNNGVGPARLRGVRVFYRGEFAADSRRLMQRTRCCTAWSPSWTSTSTVLHAVGRCCGRLWELPTRAVIQQLRATITVDS